MLNKTSYQHIVKDSDGIAYLEDTETKVVELVLDRLAYGWSADELHFQHTYLSLGQIHSALAYYWDHQDELDLEIASRLAAVEALKPTQPTTLVQKLRRQGLL